MIISPVYHRIHPGRTKGNTSRIMRTKINRVCVHDWNDCRLVSNDYIWIFNPKIDKTYYCLGIERHLFYRYGHHSILIARMKRRSQLCNIFFIVRILTLWYWVHVYITYIDVHTLYSPCSFNSPHYYYYLCDLSKRVVASA